MLGWVADSNGHTLHGGGGGGRGREGKGKRYNIMLRDSKPYVRWKYDREEGEKNMKRRGTTFLVFCYLRSVQLGVKRLHILLDDVNQRVDFRSWIVENASLLHNCSGIVRALFEPQKRSWIVTSKVWQQREWKQYKETDKKKTLQRTCLPCVWLNADSVGHTCVWTKSFLSLSMRTRREKLTRESWWKVGIAVLVSHPSNDFLPLLPPLPPCNYLIGQSMWHFLLFYR